MNLYTETEGGVPQGSNVGRLYFLSASENVTFLREFPALHLDCSLIISCLSHKSLCQGQQEGLETYQRLAWLHRLLSLWQQGGIRAEEAEIEGGGGSKNNLPEIRWSEAVHMNDGWIYNVLLMTSSFVFPDSESESAVQYGADHHFILDSLTGESKRKALLNVRDCETLLSVQSRRRSCS